MNFIAVQNKIYKYQAEDATTIALEQADFFIRFFQHRYGIPSQPALPRPNDFGEIKEYYVIRALLTALGNLRTAQGVAPPRVHDFLLEVLYLNDNTGNRFDDGYYIGTLIESIASSVNGAFFLPFLAHHI